MVEAESVRPKSTSKDAFDESSLGHEKGAVWLDNDIDSELSRVVRLDSKVELTLSQLPDETLNG